MSFKIKDAMNRRNFFKYSLLALPIVKVSSSFAAACPATKDPKAMKKLLKASDAAAKRLHFVFDATQSKDPKYAKHPGTCGNCKFFSKKYVTSDNYSKCVMMGNKYVPSCGWCKSFKAKKKA